MTDTTAPNVDALIEDGERWPVCGSPNVDNLIKRLVKGLRVQVEALRTLTAENREMLIDSVFLKSDQKLMHRLREEEIGWKAANRRLADDLLEKEATIAALTEQLEQAERSEELQTQTITRLHAQLEQHQWHRVEDELPNPGGVQVETYSDIAGLGHDVFTIDDEWHSGNHDNHSHWRYSTPPTESVDETIERLGFNTPPIPPDDWREGA